MGLCVTNAGEDVAGVVDAADQVGEVVDVGQAGREATMVQQLETERTLSRLPVGSADRRSFSTRHHIQNDHPALNKTSSLLNAKFCRQTQMSKFASCPPRFCNHFNLGSSLSAKSTQFYLRYSVSDFGTIQNCITCTPLNSISIEQG